MMKKFLCFLLVTGLKLPTIVTILIWATLPDKSILLGWFFMGPLTCPSLWACLVSLTVVWEPRISRFSWFVFMKMERMMIFTHTGLMVMPIIPLWLGLMWELVHTRSSLLKTAPICCGIRPSTLLLLSVWNKRL